MRVKSLLDKISRNLTIRINCRLFSSEIAKQHQVYHEGSSPSRCFLRIFRLSYLQAALNVYSMVATMRFLLLSMLLSKGAEERLYKYDVLMAAFDAKRHYDQYITFCTAAFVSFIVYIYYLNYFCLNKRLVDAIWATVQRAKLLYSSGGSGGSQSSVRKLMAPGDEEKKEKSGKKKKSAAQLFFKFEAVTHSLLMITFGKMSWGQKSLKLKQKHSFLAFFIQKNIFKKIVLFFSMFIKLASLFIIYKKVTFFTV